MKGDRIVALEQYNGRLMVATPTHVYDITDSNNPIIVFDAEASSKMTMGKTYVMQEVK